MRIAIFAAGGVGGYFGARLTQTSHDIIFIARGAHLDAIRTSGLRIDTSKGVPFTATPALATDQPAEVGPVDVVIVAVKTWQVSEAAAAMRPMVGGDTIIVPLLNGVEAPSQLAEVFGAERVLGGFTFVSTWIESPGVIGHNPMPIESVAFGEMDNSDSERVRSLRGVFEEANVTLRETPDIAAGMWEKFMFIASWAGVGAVTRMPLGVIRSLPETRQMLADSMREVAAVARARGVNLPPDAVAKGMAAVDNAPSESTASMQRDIMNGRPSELEAHNGAVVRLRGGVSTPTHQFIYHSLLPMEHHARSTI